MDRGESVVRILIAQEQSLFRDALKLALATEPDLDVTAEAGDASSAVAATDEVKPDVVILDARLPAFDGKHTSCLIKDCFPECKILVLADEQDQRILSDGLGCGASGYLTKSSSVSEVVDAVRAVHRGETLIPSVMLGPLLSQLIDRRRDHEQALLKISELSRREREVLGLVARGSSTNAIALALVISPETARTHVQNILTKLDVHSRLEAAAFVIESGLLDHLPRKQEERALGRAQRGA